jgi:hypothetical protein
MYLKTNIWTSHGVDTAGDTVYFVVCRNGTVKWLNTDWMNGV